MQGALHRGVGRGGHSGLGGLGGCPAAPSLGVGGDLAERHVAEDEALLTRVADPDEGGRVEVGYRPVGRADGVEGVLEQPCPLRSGAVQAGRGGGLADGGGRGRRRTGDGDDGNLGGNSTA